VEQVVLGLYIIRGDNMWVVDLVVILCVQTTEYVLVRYLS
jgi:chemotaxis signal transduction protein